jgi:hypothetical protein
VGRLTGIDTVLLLDLDGTLYVVARPGPHGAVHLQHRLDPPDRPRRPPGRAGPGRVSEPPTSRSPIPATEPPTTT